MVAVSLKKKGQTLELQFDPSKVLLFDAKSGERPLPERPQPLERKVAQLKLG